MAMGGGVRGVGSGKNSLTLLLLSDVTVFAHQLATDFAARRGP